MLPGLAWRATVHQQRDGSVDHAFKVTFGGDGANAIAVQSDGTIFLERRRVPAANDQDGLNEKDQKATQLEANGRLEARALTKKRSLAV